MKTQLAGTETYHVAHLTDAMPLCVDLRDIELDENQAQEIELYRGRAVTFNSGASIQIEVEWLTRRNSTDDVYAKLRLETTGGTTEEILAENVTLYGYPMRRSFTHVFRGSKTVRALHFVVTGLNERGTIRELIALSNNEIDFDALGPRAVSAEAFTWETSHPFPYPRDTYARVADMGYNGLPEQNTTFASFVHGSGAVNEGWARQSTVTEVDAYGHSVHVDYPNQGGTKHILRSDIMVPQATVSNTLSRESAVFTGVYDADPQGGYFDAPNGWERGRREGGVSEIDQDHTHFGAASVHVVNSCGPTTNVALSAMSDYIFSAWVKHGGTGTGDVRFAVELHRNEPGHGTQFSSYDHIERDVANDCWTYVEHRLESRHLLVKAAAAGARQDIWARIWIGNNKDDAQVTSVNVYLDGIRFYPADALVSTTYHHPTWRVPVLAVDANGHPGHFTAYDAFGRREALYRIDEERRSVYLAGNRRTVDSMAYHLSGEVSADDPLRIVSPNGGEVLYIWDDVTVRWQAHASVTAVDVHLVNLTDNSTIAIAGGIPARTGAFTWRVPAQQWASGHAYKMRVRAAASTSGSADNSNTAFSISNARLRITSPSGGRTYEPGQVEVAWTYEGLAGSETLRIEWARGDDGWATARDANGTPAEAIPVSEGAFSWVPTHEEVGSGSGYMIRLIAEGPERISARSAAFNLLWPKALAVTEPAGGERFNAGDDMSVRWKSINVFSQVKSYYTFDATASPAQWRQVGSLLPSSGSRTFRIPTQSGGPWSHCRLKVVENAPSPVQALSNEFTISECECSRNDDCGGQFCVDCECVECRGDHDCRPGEECNSGTCEDS